MSCTKVFDYRRAFAVRWAQFLHENYQGPEHVAMCFGVRYQTAVNWMSGANAPGGFAVGLAFRDHPDAAYRMVAAE